MFFFLSRFGLTWFFYINQRITISYINAIFLRFIYLLPINTARKHTISLLLRFFTALRKKIMIGSDIFNGIGLS